MSAIILLLSAAWPMSAPHKLTPDQTVSKDAPSLALSIESNAQKLQEGNKNKLLLRREIRKKIGKNEP